MSSSSFDGAYVPYSSRPEWSDVTGVAQAEPAGAPVVRIDYAPEYEDAADTFRAVLASGEASARVLALTEAIIAMNGAHYTVWHHRFRVLTELLSSPANAHANDDQDDPPWSLRDELRYVDRMAEKNPKNYQVWNHARLVSAALCASEDDRAGCLELNLTLTRRALDADAKNIHAWTHRLWCARAFDLWRAEPAFCDEMLQRDVRNNSAWSHRFVAALGEGSGDDKADAAEMARREMGYAETKLRLAPDNESAWNYLRACAAKGGWGRALGGACERVASEHAREGAPGRRHALALLAEAKARRGDRRAAADAFEALETSADPIRARYWRWKREALR